MLKGISAKCDTSINALFNAQLRCLVEEPASDPVLVLPEPQKELLDWIYLGNSPCTKLAPAPLDIDLKPLDMRRLKRLADRMQLSTRLGDNTWHASASTMRTRVLARTLLWARYDDWGSTLAPLLIGPGRAYGLIHKHAK